VSRPSTLFVPPVPDQRIIDKDDASRLIVRTNFPFCGFDSVLSIE
jgi:hypothetical protein